MIDNFDGNRGDCLEDETVTDYISGTLSPAVRLACEEHLAGCRPCRERLTLYMGLLQEEVLDSEVRLVEETTRVWNAKFGVQPSAAEIRSPVVAYAGLLVLVLAFSAVVTSGVQWINARPSAERVVSLLLSKHRPFEARLSGQSHLPFERTRAEVENRPSTSLLEGELRRLGATNLELGRLFLIQGDLDKAAPLLRPDESDQGRAAAHNDYGVYLLQRRDVDSTERALAEFNYALIEDPRFVPALFNRALAFERTGKVTDAELAWKAYLRVDPNSDWAEEARSRLKVLGR